MSLKVTNVQRFSLHDGPGIRTTVFLKGCSIACPWCCNPENIKSSLQFYFKQDECINCMGCVEACPYTILGTPEDVLGLNREQLPECLQCSLCIETCPSGALGIYGKTISTDELLEIVRKDKDYYSEGKGGVTFSGGEPLLQAEELLKSIKALKNEDINVTVETSLFAPPSCLQTIDDLVDLFIIDIKILDTKSCQEILHANLEDFKINFDEIIRKNKPYVVRFPLIKPFTFNEENINALMAIIHKYGIEYMEIFPIHDFGANKYSSMGLEPLKFEALTENEIDDLKDKLENSGVKVKLLNT